ncbi:putative necrosis-inducing factor-domain-containing protein [Chaetomidium leptoderma]|uniref:Necrosis-inducing factor-domain-containing protein n=1 Tax=Chaetomidium leptoderma TaxID=669021 RepID=A0AAN6VHW1_9PEZI|nr:putative necrosis-inducing factor-domain-containing protein [Chaetomidium leptoderma]
MQFKSTTLALLTAVLATVAECAPTTANPTSAETIGLDKRGSNECGHSTFVNQGSGASPKISDCERIIKNLANPGSWPLASVQAHKELASYGSCAFGVSFYQFHQGTVYIGTEDVKDIIRDSIKQFRRSDGKVGAKGVMGCGAQDIKIAWGLY